MFERAASATPAAEQWVSMGHLALPIAAISLVLALFCVKRAIALAGPLLRALAAAVSAALATSLALALIAAVLIQGAWA